MDPGAESWSMDVENSRGAAVLIPLYKETRNLPADNGVPILPMLPFLARNPQLARVCIQLPTCCANTDLLSMSMFHEHDVKEHMKTFLHY